jgi:drug/metabolite transporter (DMT)-like permease
LPIALKNIRKINKSNILSIAIIGFVGNGIPALLFPLAETRIDSSLTGMINSLSPVFTLLIGILIYKRIGIKTQITGVLIGFLGAFGLLYNKSFSFNYYGLYVVLATILSGFSNNEASRIKGINGLQITSLAFFLMGPFAVIHLLCTDFSAAIQTENWLRNLGFIAILAIMGSAVALALFYLLVRDTSPVFASSVTYFIPVIATLWGINDNEHLTPIMFLSVAIILIGVFIINKSGFFRKREDNMK